MLFYAGLYMYGEQAMQNSYIVYDYNWNFKN